MTKYVSRERKAVAAALAMAGLITAGSLALARVNTRHAAISEARAWKAPKRANKITNPTKMTAANISAGKSIFVTNCVMCHGVHGNGNGTAGAFLSVKPADFRKAAFWKQGEGAIFWKLSHGKSPMPAFRDKLSRHKRWQVIDYLASAFKPKS